MRISDWSSDVCSSARLRPADHCVGEDSRRAVATQQRAGSGVIDAEFALQARLWRALARQFQNQRVRGQFHRGDVLHPRADLCADLLASRSEEHTSELQSLMRISYAVFCLKKKNTNTIHSH